nr:DNA cytosine methyltransferase [Azospirillum sp. OGB3]
MRRAQPRTESHGRQFSLSLKSTADDELDVDLFAGGGGASEGIEQALGKPVDLAVNHDAAAIAMHEINHPRTEHFHSDVYEVEPHIVCRGRSIRNLWASPDCRHFSKASGKSLRSPKIRGLMWVVIKWARLPEWQRPKVIYVENVSEMLTAGPTLDEPILYPFPDGSAVAPDSLSEPVKSLQGLYFRQWQGELERLGYQLEFRSLPAHHYGVPTIRTRLFIVARRDGLPVVWPEPTHGDPRSDEVRSGQLKPYTWASTCIDFSLPTRSIFGRTKPLVDATLDRLAHGTHRFMIASSMRDGHEPFVATLNHAGKGFRGFASTEPAKTITAARDAHGLVMATTTQITQRGSRSIKVRDPRGPHPTIVTKNESALLTAQARPLSDRGPTNVAYLAQHNTGEIGHSLRGPASTITTTGSHQQPVLAALQRLPGNSIGPDTKEAPGTAETRNAQGLHGAHIVVLKGTCKDGRPLDRPAPAVLASGMHQGLVQTRLEPVGAAVLGEVVPFEDALLTAVPKRLHEQVRAVRRFLARVDWKNTRGLRKLPPAEPDAFLTALAAQLGYDGPATDLPHLLGLCRVNGGWFQIVDLSMRMLVPQELKLIQGFPPEYVIDRTSNGRTLTQEQQIARIGNSVCPELARVLVAANSPPRRRQELAA